MSFKAYLVDAFLGSGNKSRVGNKGQLYASLTPPELPAIGTSNSYKFFSDYFTLNGAGVTTNMNVNGATTNQEFSIKCLQEQDLYICKLIIYLEDNSVSHATFGALTALTNGVNCISFEGNNQSYILKEVKKFTDLIIQTGMEQPFGDAATAFELDAVTGSADAMLLPFTISDIVPGGIRLGHGTLDKISFFIRDDLSSVDKFTVRALGYIHCF